MSIIAFDELFQTKSTGLTDEDRLFGYDKDGVKNAAFTLAVLKAFFGGGDWNTLANKPGTFAPSGHTLGTHTGTEGLDAAPDGAMILKVAGKWKAVVPGFANASDIPNVPAWVLAITETMMANWEAAFGWGNHASAGYLTEETDPVFAASVAASISETDKANWAAAFGWGDHADAGYLTAETDPVFTASAAAGISLGNISVWNTKTFEYADFADGDTPVIINGEAKISGLKANLTENPFDPETEEEDYLAWEPEALSFTFPVPVKGVPGVAPEDFVTKSQMVDLEYLEDVEAGSNVTIDKTDPKKPIISAIGGGGGEDFSWTIRSSAADNNWLSVCYGNGIFVAVSQTGTGNRVMTSPDGVNWTIRTSAANNSWNSVCYGNGIFVAVAQSGTGNRVMTSPDGINWTIRTSAANTSWRSVCYGNGIFVAVSQSGTGNRVMTSPDGINWTIRTSAADNTWNSVCYGNGLYVAVSSGGSTDRVMTSPDGVNWTSRDSPTMSQWNSVCYGNGLYVAVSSGGNNMYSSDGISWVAAPTVGTSWLSVCYGEGIFVATSVFGTGNRVMTSPDGINWTIRTSAADNAWTSVCYGNGVFVSVANNGTGNRVMTMRKMKSYTGDMHDVYERLRRKPGYNASVPQYLTHDATGEFVWVNI
jgi:predicted RecA/RadA family phage recombinase